MIRYVKGDIFDSQAEALVNPVNCVGVMGRGLALKFKNNFPDNFEAYANACDGHRVEIGACLPFKCGKTWVVNFPTKDHWRNKSEMEWIVWGLNDLRRWLVEDQINSVALPPLGCGLGGLKWVLVKAEIERALASLKCNIEVYEP